MLVRLGPTFSAHKDGYENAGEFLPLWVWETRGFNPDDIKNKSLPKDVRGSRMFDKVYRVPILKTFSRGRRGTVRKEALSSAGKPSKRAMVEAADAPAAADDDKAVKEETDLSDDSSDDASSSSDSDSDSSSNVKGKKKHNKKDKKKKAKKAKRAKKEKKRLAKEKKKAAKKAKFEKQEAAKKEKLSKQNEKSAQQMVAKLSPIIAMMEDTLRNVSPLVPEPIKMHAADALAELKGIHQQASLVVGRFSLEMPSKSAEDVIHPSLQAPGHHTLIVIVMCLSSRSSILFLDHHDVRSGTPF